jgi:predicted GNAT superfamily acetyltransferase
MSNLDPENSGLPIHQESESSAIEVRNLQPQDHTAYLEVVASAWPGLQGLQEHDFIAKATMGNLLGAFDQNGQLLGFSDNVVGAGKKKEVLVHMIASRQETQDRGVGQRLMEANFELFRNGALSPDYQVLALTSDPLESRNVGFYLHKNPFVASQYKVDAYKAAANSGSITHQGLPQDRFYYRARPNSAWAMDRQLPQIEQYVSLLDHRSTFNVTQLTNNTLPVLVEIPYDIQAIKAEDLEAARSHRIQQRRMFQWLFVSGFTALDQFRHDGRSFIVLMHGFDHNNPTQLVDLVNGKY